jgi:ribosomal protein L11 methylase PrmA
VSRSAIDASFRDPSGFVFEEAGVIYRQVNQQYAENYERLMTSGLYEELTTAGLLIRHREAAVAAPDPARGYKVIQPEPVWFVSHPYEWSFSQLKDAALTTLQIQRRALRRGMSLKDASAYNLQFVDGRFKLIDTLSFERYEEGKPWVAYRQFCQHFLAALALMSYSDARLSQLLRTYLDGIPLDLASRLLPGRTRLVVPLLLHIHLHASSQRRHANRPDSAQQYRRHFGSTAFVGLLDSLESGIRRLAWRPSPGGWAEYYDDLHHYAASSSEQKTRLVAHFVDQVRPSLLWDLGANTGVFSRLSSDRGIRTVAFDLDPACVDAMYNDAKERGDAFLLPLLMDLTNPSPGTGWANTERMSLTDRGPADLILDLALVHHFAIGNNVPLARIADFMSQTGRALVVEFVPKADIQVRRMLANRVDIFGGYDEADFVAAFGRHFSIVKKVKLEQSERSLYLLTRTARG